MNTPKVLSILPRRKGNKAPKSCFDLFPSGRRCFIYAMGFVGGVVKVGRARNVRGRILQHARKVDGEVLWAHVFERGSEHYSKVAESAALAELEKVCDRINKSEWFHCDDKALVLRTVRSVLARAKAQVDKWENERAAAANRSALASRLLAEHDANAKKLVTPDHPAPAKAAPQPAAQEG